MSVLLSFSEMLLFNQASLHDRCILAFFIGIEKIRECIMRIKKILNTNAILSEDMLGHQMLLLGSGVGFRHRPGDVVDKKPVEKNFILTDPTQMNRFEQIMGSIPPEYIPVTEKIIDYAVNFHHMELNEAIHVTLVDHLYNAVCNLEDGVSIPNSLLSDIARFYPNEYDVGCHGLLLVHQKLGWQLPEDEAGFIAMHFVTAQQKEENLNAKKMIQLVREINDRILGQLNIETDKNSISYYRYMTHLKCFAQRVLQNYHYPDDNESSILQTLMEQYPKEYACSKDVCEYIRQKYGYNAGTDEEIYLAVHLARLSYK